MAVVKTTYSMPPKRRKKAIANQRKKNRAYNPLVLKGLDDEPQESARKPKKPAKLAPKRVKRPKAPKTRLVTDATLNGQPASGLTFTGSTTPAPKTRVGRSRVLAEVDRLLKEDRRMEALRTFERILFYGTPDEYTPPQSSRWSRLWAWLDGFRWGRP